MRRSWGGGRAKAQIRRRSSGGRWLKWWEVEYFSFSGGGVRLAFALVGAWRVGSSFSSVGLLPGREIPRIRRVS